MLLIPKREMDSSWLRGLGQRSHVPSKERTSPPPEDKKGDDNHHQHSLPQISPQRHRARPVIHKVSSLLSVTLGGGGRDSGQLATAAAAAAGASPITTTGAYPPDEDTDEQQENRPPRRRRSENTWHNPSLMQIVEAVQVAIMSNPDPLAAIPVKYNGYVLRLIEGFARSSERVDELELELRELNTLREKELEQFRGVSDEWIQKENGYKAEIKRLEMVLANESKDGMASVALARSGTLVDRSASKRFQARLKRLSNSEEQVQEKLFADGTRQVVVVPPRGASHHKTIRNIPRILNHNSDVIMSQIVKRREAVQLSAHLKRDKAPARPIQPYTSSRVSQQEPTYIPTGATRRQAQNSRPSAPDKYDSSSTSSGFTTSTEDEQMELRHCALQAKDFSTGQPNDQRNMKTVVSTVMRHVDQSEGEVYSASPCEQRVGQDHAGPIVTENFVGGQPPSRSAEDYFSRTQPQPEPQKRRLRSFSFKAGDNDVLAVTPTATEDPSADTRAKPAVAFETTYSSSMAPDISTCEVPPRTEPVDLVTVDPQVGSYLFRTSGKTTSPTSVGGHSTSSSALPIHASEPSRPFRAHREKVPLSDSTGSVVYVGIDTDSSATYVGNGDKRSSDLLSPYTRELPSAGDVSRVNCTAPNILSGRSEARLPLGTDASASENRANSLVTDTSGRGGIVAIPPASRCSTTDTPRGENTCNRGLERRLSSSATSSVLSVTEESPKETANTISARWPTGLELPGKAAQIAAARAAARGNRRAQCK